MSSAPAAFCRFSSVFYQSLGAPKWCFWALGATIKVPPRQRPSQSIRSHGDRSVPRFSRARRDLCPDGSGCRRGCPVHNNDNNPPLTLIPFSSGTPGAPPRRGGPPGRQRRAGGAATTTRPPPGIAGRGPFAFLSDGLSRPARTGCCRGRRRIRPGPAAAGGCPAR